MKVFAGNHSGQTVPGYSVVVAETAAQAQELLVGRLKAIGIEEPWVNLAEVDTTTEGALVLWDGEP